MDIQVILITSAKKYSMVSVDVSTVELAKMPLASSYDGGGGTKFSVAGFGDASIL